MRRRGFSVLEVTLGSALLLMVVFTLFAIFELGSHHFKVGLMRQGIQADARRAWLLLERDLRQTCLEGVNSSARNVTVELAGKSAVARRDAVCMPSLAEWNQPASFSTSTGMPLWDRYLLYYATLDDGDARLYRVELRPPKTFTGQPLNGLAALVAPLGPPPPVGSSLGTQTTTALRLAAAGVHSFTANPSGKDVQVLVLLHGQTRGEDQQASREELFEVNLKIVPGNHAQ